MRKGVGDLGVERVMSGTWSFGTVFTYLETIGRTSAGDVRRVLNVKEERPPSLLAVHIALYFQNVRWSMRVVSPARLDFHLARWLLTRMCSREVGVRRTSSYLFGGTIPQGFFSSNSKVSHPGR